MAVFVLFPLAIGHFVEDPIMRFVVFLPSEIILSVWFGIEFRRRFIDKLSRR